MTGPSGLFHGCEALPRLSKKQLHHVACLVSIIANRPPDEDVLKYLEGLSFIKKTGEGIIITCAGQTELRRLSHIIGLDKALSGVALRMFEGFQEPDDMSRT